MKKTLFCQFIFHIKSSHRHMHIDIGMLKRSSFYFESQPDSGCCLVIPLISFHGFQVEDGKRFETGSWPLHWGSKPGCDIQYPSQEVRAWVPVHLSWRYLGSIMESCLTVRGEPWMDIESLNFSPSFLGPSSPRVRLKPRVQRPAETHNVNLLTCHG